MLLRINSEIPKQAQSLYDELGINLTTSISIFLRESIRVGGLPFEVCIDRLNKETVVAMLEAERIVDDPTVKRYSNVEDALRALKE